MSGFMATLGVAGLVWGIYIPWSADRLGRRSTLQMVSLFGALLSLSIAYLPGGITPLLAAGFVSFLTGPAIVIAVAVVTDGIGAHRKSDYCCRCRDGASRVYRRFSGSGYRWIRS